MNYEIKGISNLPTLYFDDEQLTVDEKEYTYDTIKDLEISYSPLFSTFGIVDVQLTDGTIEKVPYNRHKQETLKQAIRQFKKIKQNPQTKQSSSSQAVPYDELVKLKSLLDNGIITEDEFNAKKKQLLNI